MWMSISNWTIRRRNVRYQLTRRLLAAASREATRSLSSRFEHGTLRLTCNGDTDDIVVVACERMDRSDEIVNDDLLADLVGKVIEQAWTMVNDRGYADGFQLPCVDLATRSESCRQF